MKTWLRTVLVCAALLLVLHTGMICAEVAADPAAGVGAEAYSSLQDAPSEGISMRGDTVSPDAFFENLVGFFSGINPEQDALSLSWSQGGQQLLQGTVQKQADLLSIDLQAAGIPIGIQIGKDAVWTGFAGKAYELRYADIGNLLRPSDSPDAKVWVQIAQLFAEDVLRPGITVERREAETVILADYAAQALLQRTAAFGDRLLASEAYLSEIEKAWALYCLSQSRPVPEPGTVAAMWPAIRESMLSSGVDGRLTLEIILWETGVSGHAQLVSSGNSASATFEARNLPDRAVLKAGAYLAGREALNLDCELEKDQKTFEGKLILPAVHEAFSITGIYGEGIVRCEFRDGADGFTKSRAVLVCETLPGSFLGKLTITPYRQAPLSADLSVSASGLAFSVSHAGRRLAFDCARTTDYRTHTERLTAKLALPDGYSGADLSAAFNRAEIHLEGSCRTRASRNTLAFDYALPDRRLSLELGRNGQTASLVIDGEPDGRFTAELKLPDRNAPGANLYSSYSLRGQITPSYTSLKGEYMARGTRQAAFDLTAARRGDCISILSTLNRQRAGETYALQAMKTARDVWVDFQAEGQRASARILPDMSVHAELEDGRLIRTIDGGLVSNTLYRADYAVGRSRPYALDTSLRSLACFQLAVEKERKLDCRVETSEGASLFSAAVERVPAQPVTPLSEQAPIRIDSASLRGIMRQLAD